MKIRIDTYYDITCDGCAKSWSTDFDGKHMTDSRFASGGMGMATSKSLLRRNAYVMGWKNRGGKTLCPECLAKWGKDENLPVDIEF